MVEVGRKKKSIEKGGRCNAIEAAGESEATGSVGLNLLSSSESN